MRKERSALVSFASQAFLLGDDPLAAMVQQVEVGLGNGVGHYQPSVLAEELEMLAGR